MQQSSLGAIREPLIYGQIAGEHDTHVVRPVEYLLRLKGPVEVPGKVNQPRILCANFGADKTRSFLPIPISPASTRRQLVRLSYAAHMRY